MKKIILLSTTLLIVSCGNPQKDKVVELVKNSMKDPKTFDLIKFETKDTTFTSDYLGFILSEDSLNVELLQGSVELYKDFISNGSTYWSEDLQEKQKELKEVQRRIDSCVGELSKIKETGQDPVHVYEHYVSCYGANSFGMKVINEFRVNEYPKDGLMTLHYIEPSLKP